MKKATDKIYLATTEEIQSLDSSFVGIAHSDPEDIIEPIEYVRKDAFIEKACDAYCKVCGHYSHTTPNHICRQACDYYKDFRNYMKGE